MYYTPVKLENDRVYPNKICYITSTVHKTVKLVELEGSWELSQVQDFATHIRTKWKFATICSNLNQLLQTVGFLLFKKNGQKEKEP